MSAISKTSVIFFSFGCSPKLVFGKVVDFLLKYVNILYKKRKENKKLRFYLIVSNHAD